MKMADFTELKWQSLGGACEGANVPGGVVMVVSLQGGKGTKVRSGLACAMTFVPNVAIVVVGDKAGLVSTIDGQFANMEEKIVRFMGRIERRRGKED